MEREKTAGEIHSEGRQADEVLERRKLAKESDLIQQSLEFQQAQMWQSSIAANTYFGITCEFASMPRRAKRAGVIHQHSHVELRRATVRINAGITNVNPACNTHTPSMQKPETVIAQDPQRRFQ